MSRNKSINLSHSPSLGPGPGALLGLGPNSTQKRIQSLPNALRLALIVLPVFLQFFLSRPLIAEGPSNRCQRIVSISPSITEELFALGLSKHIVGVTRFCLYPPDALKIPKIGGYIDPNLEAILLLNPSIVLLPKELRDIPERLKALKIDAEYVDHSSVNGILGSIGQIGKLCEIEGRAEALSADIKGKLTRIDKIVSGLPKVRTMVVVGRGDSSTKSIFVSGNDGFYNDMISLAGGENVNPASTISFPVMSAEGILKVNPEIIFEIAYNPGPDFSEKRILDEWSYYNNVSAVRNGRVHIFSEHLMSIPGPRFVIVLEKMARLIHPEAKWN